jgi:hypothetical protein
MKCRQLMIVTAWFALGGGGASAADRVDLEGTQILGARELPKVLYIVPWKKPLPGDLVGKPVNSLLDEALAPVDRDVFRRQVQYHGLMGVASVPLPVAPTRVVSDKSSSERRK